MLVTILGYYALVMAGLTLLAVLFVEKVESDSKRQRRTLVWLVHVGFLAVAVLAFRGAF
jgi:hypothetical protein